MAPGGARGRRRAALIIVHGIGEQSPYASLDRVARGLRTALAGRVDRLAATSTVFDDRVTTGVRLELDTPLARSGADELDIYESYWAPLPRGLITVRGMVKWLTTTMLGPIRHWSQIRLESVSLGRRLELVVGQLALSLTFVALLATEVAILIWYQRQLGFDPFDEHDFGVWVVAEAAAGLATLAFLVHALRGTALPRLARARRRLSSWYIRRVRREPVAVPDEGLVDERVGQESRAIWGRTAWAAFLPLAATVVLIELLVDSGADAPGRSLVHLAAEVAGRDLGQAPIDEISDIGVDLWIGIALLVAAAAIARFLTSVGGDVALYVDEERDTAAGHLRSHILESVQGQIRTLLEDPAYERVHVLGHSLGTVIGYDALNRFRLEAEHARSTEGCAAGALIGQEAYDRIGSFVTVACPLDHIDAFWRARAARTRPIQYQVLSRRNSLRSRSGYDEMGRFHFEHDFDSGVRRGYYPLEPSNFAWLNIKASPDPIGTRLLGYHPDESHTLRYFPPNLWAHTTVMGDRRTYELMLRYL